MALLRASRSALTAAVIGALGSLIIAPRLAVSAPPPAAPAPQRAPRTVVFAHTNDLHAHHQPDASGRGGLAAISGVMERARQQHGEGRVLALDAGDIVSGSPLDEYEAHGVKTAVMLDFLEAVGYDAWALGNHEFDRGLDVTRQLVEASAVPVLSCNLTNAEGGPAFGNLAASKVFEVDGVTVGVIGATTQSVAKYTRADLAGVVIGDPVACVRAEVARLRPSVDVLVALSHMGIEEDRNMAASVPGLDLVIGGHSHTFAERAERVGTAWVVQAGCYAEALGLGVYDVDAKTFSWSLIRPDASASADARPAVVALDRRWTEVLTRDWGQVLGEARVSLTRGDAGESWLGTWISEVMRAAVDADVGVANGSGLRADLPAGSVRREQVYQVLPFGNEIVKLKLRGRDLIAIAMKNASASIDTKHGRVLQQSGLRYQWRVWMGAPELLKVEVRGKPIDPDAWYQVATSDFVASQWGRYGEGTPAETVRTGVIDRDAVEAALRAQGIRAAPIPGGTRTE